MPDLTTISTSRPGSLTQQDKLSFGEASYNDKDTRNGKGSRNGLMLETMMLASSWQQESPGLTFDAVIGLEQPKLDFQDFKGVLGLLKMKLSPAHTESLGKQMFEVTGGSKGSLDFPSFLRMMRWMIDTNFAHLNELTATAAKSVGLAAAPKDAEGFQLALQPCLPRRCSV